MMQMSEGYEKNKKNNIVAVVVTYNRKDILQKCIKNLLGQKEVFCDVFIIDNASTDGTEEMVRSQFSVPEVFYYNTGSNLGGAGGFQYGIKHAVLAKYEYIWIMDDDTWPEDNALAELMHADRKLKGNWGFLSSVAYWLDGTICEANVQKRNIFKRIDIDRYCDEVVKVHMASFVSLFVKACVVKEVGLPIGEYFIWTDDYEYTGRISKKYSGYVATKSKVVHAMRNHTRVNFAKDNTMRMERYRCLYRNDIHCYRGYGIQGWVYILLKDIYTLFDILINSEQNRLDKIRIIILGIRDGLRFRPKIEMIDEGSSYGCDCKQN